MPTPRQTVDIERMVRLFAATAIFLYVLGLIAINGYLFRLGISDFTLVRTRFIYTGTLISMFAAWMYTFTIWASIFYRRALTHVRRQSPSTRIREHLTALRESGGLAFTAVTVSLLGPFMILRFTTGRYLFLPTIAIWLAAVGTGFIASDYLKGAAKFWVGPSARQSVPSIALSLGALSVLLIYVATFMATVYPEMPEQFGGGRPRIVRVLVKQEAVSGAQEIGLDIPNRQQLSAPVELVYEGEKSYVLHMEDGTLLQVDKGIIAALIVVQ